MKNIFTKKGFTLIEILIVVAIIGILSSVVVVGLGPAQRKGRDSRRLSDLRSVQTALELYYGKEGHYPTGVTTWELFSATLINADIGVKQVPVGPSNNETYFYGTDSAGSTYVLGTVLEEPSTIVMGSSYKGIPPSEDGTPIPTGKAACGEPDGNFYCLTL